MLARRVHHRTSAPQPQLEDTYPWFGEGTNDEIVLFPSEGDGISLSHYTDNSNSALALTDEIWAWLEGVQWDTDDDIQPVDFEDENYLQTSQPQRLTFPSYDEEDLLNWAVAIENPPPRPSGVIQVKLKYKGRSKPIPAENPWEE